MANIDEPIAGYRLPSEEVDLVKLFGASEGELTLIYGHIRMGKTLLGTDMGIRAADSGIPVYFNYPVKYEGYDERANIFTIILSFVWPWKDRFFRMEPSLVRQFKIDDDWARTQKKPDGQYCKDFWDWLQSRTDCLIVADEGHTMLDSYKKTYMSMEARETVLETGHFNRKIIIISQRPTAVHVSARGNVNIFYKCERLLRWPFLLFKRTEFQDMINETVDETKPLHVKYVIARRRVLKAYNSKYLRAGAPTSQNIDVTTYDFYYSEKARLFKFWWVSCGISTEKFWNEVKERIENIRWGLIRPWAKKRPTQEQKTLRSSALSPVALATGVRNGRLSERLPLTARTLKNEVRAPFITSSEAQDSKLPF